MWLSMRLYWSAQFLFTSRSVLLLVLNNELLNELQTKESLSWVLNKLTDLQVLCDVQTHRQSDYNLDLFNVTSSTG